MSRRPMRFARQVLALQIGLIVLVTGIGFAIAAALLDRGLVEQYGQRALGVARSVAADDELARGVTDPALHPLVAAKAERVRAATGALFIVVTDSRGVRLSHPVPEKIGDPVSTDPSAALTGREAVDVQRGTLGWSARGKVPLRTADGTVVGQVSVGFDAHEIDTAFLRLLGTSAGLAAGALLLGVAGAALLTRLLKRRTLGLEPHELAELVRQREAVLYGIGEGVLALDADERVTVCNAETERLLGRPVEPGTPVRELDLPPRLRSALLARRPVDNLITVTADRVLVVHHRPVLREGVDLGAVVTLRDRTDLDKLTRELDAVRGTADVLRAQRHEFTNRLHALSGLLQTGHRQEAEDYLQALFSGSIAGLGPAADAVRDSYLVSFLGAKKAAAGEKDVTLELGETSWVATGVVAPVEVTTVLGNLVDNACDAARSGRTRPAVVEVDLLSDGTALHLSVLDSGDGVPAAMRDEVFTEGTSTKGGEGHGIGLALARQAAHSLGGEVRLADPGGAGRGALFVARLPGALAATGETTEQETKR
ncbi:sensor histidine kinase [Saccharopolyspora gloriosae]|uniref:histidine kinase n=1 Tax=Saccharopolyspora gloriosae TaxID=455344 RepID=A0A840NFR3_9PSEU|nr:sensor histidine kinase [Saccharopolyspora gloriosae]MBB5069821.1 two-component system CitB family sensor kinase [Saccharopolyspora gloriosae]